MRGYTLILLSAFVAVMHGHLYEFKDQLVKKEAESKANIADQEDKQQVMDDVADAVPESDYTPVGCWRDTPRRAVPMIDGSDPRIRGNYRVRADAINKCYQVARQKKMRIFAVQDQGQCFAANTLKGYKKYGKSNRCKNGKGGVWANSVYQIATPKNCITTGGPNTGSPCVFPFTGLLGDYCPGPYCCNLDNDSNGNWCATEVKWDGSMVPSQFGYCKGTPCEP